MIKWSISSYCTWLIQAPPRSVPCTYYHYCLPPDSKCEECVLPKYFSISQWHISPWSQFPPGWPHLSIIKLGILKETGHEYPVIFHLGECDKLKIIFGIIAKRIVPHVLKVEAVWLVIVDHLPGLLVSITLAILQQEIVSCSINFDFVALWFENDGSVENVVVLLIFTILCWSCQPYLKQT